MTAAVVELRQYRLHPGQRDTLIELFDSEFVETQEAVGMSVLGQFRDPDRPDYFVWLRGFTDMISRHNALTSFYNGAVWARYRDAANATMIDSDNVLLLRPATPADALPDHDPARRASHDPTGTVFAVIQQQDDAGPAAVERFRSQLIPELEGTGTRTIGLYETEHAENTFTRLPVRTDDVIVWFGVSSAEIPSPWHALQRAVAGTIPRTTHRLDPTSRSLLDGTASTTPADRERRHARLDRRG